MSARVLALLTAGLMLSGPAAPQESTSATWGQATAAKLSRFLPKPVPGLVSNAPWDQEADNHVDLSVGFDASVSTKSTAYVVSRAVQKWWFDDPELFHEVASVESARKSSDQKGLDNARAHLEELKALQKQAQELASKGQTKELQVVIEKIKALAGGARNQEMSDRLRTLRGSARSLDIHIEANASVADTLDASVRPNGTVQGRPLYRVVWPGPVQPMTWVNLGVNIGPPGFRNPSTGGSKSVLRHVLVWARIASRPDTVTSDEALARQLLATIDYAGLAKLIEAGN
jgi:hypothetical protein